MPPPDTMGLTTRDAPPAAVRRVVCDNYGLLAAAGLWTVAIGASLGANLLFDEVAVEDLARIEARTAYRELLRTKAPLMGPRICQLGESVLAFRGHVTSLDSIVPESRPDAWERRALQRLAGGTAEVSQTSRIDGQEYLRLMHSLTVEPGENRRRSSFAAPGFESTPMLATTPPLIAPPKRPAPRTRNSMARSVLPQPAQSRSRRFGQPIPVTCE